MSGTPASLRPRRAFLDGAPSWQNLNIRLNGLLVLGALLAGPVSGQEPLRELTVHLAQASNDTPYAFVRAKFEPGEVVDPWGVRFFDQRGKEIPYFVWDSLSWRTAREGRADWGNRYALLNHHPGNAPEALEMRRHRLEAAKLELPELGAALAAQDEASRQSGDSVCAALFLVRHSVLYKRDRQGAAKLLQGCPDPTETAADAMRRIRQCLAGGSHPITGTTKDGGEGWLHNPAYAGVDVPVSLRFMEHFRLYGLAKHPKPEYRKALLEWADFSLGVLGGKPLDWEKLQRSYRSVWSNRMVMLIPLLLRAYQETSDETYARAARLLFDDVLMSQVEKGPHGYFWAWGHSPQKAELFDPNYNVAAFDRGIIDFWSEGQLPIIGKDRATRFVAAQARYLAFSGQFLDTLETDSMTAVQSHFPGGIPSGIGQVSLFLFDDFPFYRGLVGDAIRWAAIDDGGTVERREGRRNLYALKIGSRGAVFWAYGIGRGTPSRSRTAREMLERWLAALGSNAEE